MEISGATVRAYRERLQMTQSDFADALGMSQALISQVERGHGPVSKRLLKRLRTNGEAHAFRPTFEEFLSEGGASTNEEADSVRRRVIQLEAWATRIDLRKPVETSKTSGLLLPGLAEGARAFRFNPPPRFVEPDQIAVFRPARLADLVRDQVVLIQFKAQHGTKDLPAGIAHLGRAVVVRKGRLATYQFEPADQGSPIVSLDAEAVEVVMTRVFQGRFWP